MLNMETRSFVKDEDGSGNVFSIMLLLISLTLGAYGLDYSSATDARTQMQITADSAAHAALLTRELNSHGEAVNAALAVAAAQMPESRFGTVLQPQDVVFGTWDPDTRAFVPDAESKTAVQVTTRMTSETGNALQTYLYRLLGQKTWDVVAQATFETYKPTCLREGFVADGVVDLQSNNSYSDGFCVHSNEFVSLNSNNYFEPGTVVSMTDLSQIDLPASGYDSNEGLREALREGSWFIRIIDRLPDIIAGLRNGDRDYLPDYITNIVPLNLANRTVYQEDIVSGRIHIIPCKGGAAATIKNDVIVSRAVLISACDIKFEAGVKLEDAIVATTSTGSKSLSSSAGFTVGRADNCMPGGDAQLITLGSMDFPSDLQLYNAQLLATHDITFSANASGIQGAALVAGGEISGTSNMVFGYCGGGMDGNFHADYFRLVQ
ncbi:TadG family pilus assembly protein [Thioclava sp. FR2]|uniref:TadG family pilus assembly protein n=1 Tax=Thioclava sp. FR2 TaxID=3445780 RepID=UPI003EBFFAE6